MNTENIRKVVYISGPISGKKCYWKDFEHAEAELKASGFIAINPATLPEGMTKEQYMRINFASIDAADAVLLLPDWETSFGARLEAHYCEYIGKLCTPFIEVIEEKLNGK